MKRLRCSLLFLSVLLLLSGLAGCAPGSDGTPAPTDVLTQTIPSPDKIPVTVLVKSAFSIQTFEEAAEAKFPDLDLIQVGNYSRDMGIAAYEARLAHDDLTDLVMTWPLNVGEEYWDERLLDLSAFPFSADYSSAMLGDISRDGKLYYLPGPSQVRALVYNKTLFAEQGWQLPHSFEEFIALCQTIEKSGIRSLQLGLENSEVLDTAFVGFGHGGSFGKLEDAQALADYNAGKGSFRDHFSPALDSFQALIDAGVLQKGDLDVDYADREYMLFNRRCAMVEDSVLMARMGERYNGCTDEFALMPFWNPGPDGDWARLYPVCFIGLNRQLAQPQNKEKYNLILALMAYISSPEGQAALVGDTGAMFSSLNGVPPPNIPEIEALLPALIHGRYGVFPTLQNAQSTLRTGLAGMVDGTLSREDVITMVDRRNSNPPIPALELTIGTATEDFTLIDTGSFLTDAMRAEAQSDVALFLDNGKDGRYNGKGLNARIYKGPQTEEDLGRILPDLRFGERGVLWVVEMTGADLLNTLEYAIPVDHDQTGWFYYFSGLKMEYAPAATQGERIRNICDDQGKAIDPERWYSIAVMDETVPEQYCRSVVKTDTLIHDIFSGAMDIQTPISPAKDGRFRLAQP